MRVKLSSRVISLEVDLSLVDEPNNLDIIRCLHVLQTSESTRGDKAGTPTRLGAPGNFLTLSVGDEGVGLGWRPKAEI